MTPKMLSKEMPYCKFILPTAPTQPVTMNMGMSMPSWYDIVGLDERRRRRNANDTNGFRLSMLILFLLLAAFLINANLGMQTFLVIRHWLPRALLQPNA